MKTLLVVPLYGDLLPEFETHIQELSSHIDILLVNNDASRTYSHLPNVILNTENNVYSAWNLGVRESIRRGYEYTIISGTDVIFPIETVERLDNLVVYHQHPFICTRQLYDMASQINYPRISTLAFPQEAKRSVGDYLERQAHFDCCAIRNEVFEDIGFFDEQFKIYFGDSDFVLRMHFANYSMSSSSNCLSLHMHKQVCSTWSSRQHSLVSLINILEKDSTTFVKRYEKTWDDAQRITWNYMHVNLFAIKTNLEVFDAKQYAEKEFMLRGFDLLT